MILRNSRLFKVPQMAFFWAVCLPGLALAVSDWKGSSSSGSGSWDGSAGFWTGGKPSTSGTAVFGAATFPTAGTVSLDDSNFTSGSPEVLDIITGTWTFNDNLVSGTWGDNDRFGNSTMIFGDGVGNTPTVTINGVTGGKPLAFENIILGANGSSGNQIGTGGATVNLNNISFNSAPNIVVGSTTGGSNNVLLITAGSVFNGANLANITINTDGATENNNSVAISGASVNLVNPPSGAGTGGAIMINGFSSGGVQANNQFSIANGGSVTTRGGITVGAGSQFLVNTGGTYSGAGIVVDQYGSAVFDGANGGATVTDGANGALSSGISVSGTMSLRNGASVNNNASSSGIPGILVNAGGLLQVDSSTLTTQGGSPSGQALLADSISGTLAITNGSVYADNSTSGQGVLFDVNSGGGVTVDGGSTLNIGNDILTIASGASLSVTNGSIVTVNDFNLPSGTLTVDSTSSFTFSTLGGLGGGKGSNTLQVNGTVTWGSSAGLAVSKNSKNDTNVNLILAVGTTLLLGGGNYDLSNLNGGAGSIEVQSGATLGGNGTIGQVANGGTPVTFDGGSTLSPGTTGAIGTLNFAETPIFTGTTTIVMKLDFGQSDQIVLESAGGLNLDGGAGFIEIKLELAPDIIAAIDAGLLTSADLAGQDYQLLSASGILGLAPGSFSFDSSALAPYDLEADPNAAASVEFAANGDMDIITGAVPEPSSTWELLLGVGTAFAFAFGGAKRRKVSRK